MVTVKDPAHTIFMVNNIIVNMANVESIFDSDDSCCIRYVSGYEMFFRGISSEEIWKEALGQD